jgi:hemolysin activation/secretion protein
VIKNLPFCALTFLFLADFAAADVQVQNLTVTGYTVLSDEEVDATVTPLVQQQQAAAEALQRKVREAGAFAAQVYVHPLAEGKVELRVIEGRLAEDGVVLKTSSPRLADDKLNKLLEHTLQPGTKLTSVKTERAILLANDLPGMAGSYSSIVPADQVGEARFEFTPLPAPLVAGHAYYDNFGSTYTGRHRAGGGIELNSPFKQGDKLSLGGNVSYLGTTFIYADASLPFALPSLRAGVSLDALDYKTDEANNLRGESNHVSAYLHYALIRSRTTNLHVELRYGRERMEDETNTTRISDRVVDLGSVGLMADHHDGGGTIKAELQVHIGDLDLSGYAPYEQTDAQTAETAGSFTRATWRLNRLQHVSGPWQAFIETSGQIASKRLDASQGISFGGPTDFSGYHAGEIVGDEGAKLHVDVRNNLSMWGGHQQWSFFYDIGRVKTHAVEVVGGFIVPGIDDNYYTLQTLGIGFHQQWEKLQVQAALGTAIDNEIPDALLDSSNNDNVHGWLQLSYTF